MIGHDASNLAAFGWDWVEPSGTQMQLVLARGTEGLTLGMRRSLTDARWHTMRVSEPKRFLGEQIPKNARDWYQVVDRWFAASEATVA